MRLARGRWSQALPAPAAEAEHQPEAELPSPADRPPLTEFRKHFIMRPIDEREIRASFINASRKEVSSLSLPSAFSEIDFDRLDYLGWADQKFARRAYVVTEVDGVLTGVLLQRAEQRVLARAQCSWCEDVTLRNDVQFFSARKAG